MLTPLLLAAVAFGASLLTLFSGFGLGTLLLPAFALFLPVAVAVAATAVVHAANNVFKVILLGKSADRSVVLRFGLPAVAASFLGALVLVRISGGEPLATWDFLGRSAEITTVKLTMGLLILRFAVFELLPARRAVQASRKWLPLGGVLSGFFGGLSGHQGALRAVFLVPLGLTPTRFAATQAVIGLMVDAARLAVYGGSFALFRSADAPDALPWGLVAMACVCAFAGAFLGARLLGKVTMEGLRLLVGGLLILVGIALAVGVA